ncbi:hypothetical protein MWG12_04705 [Fusobacterium necrophorum]|uniref:hypothetical protein n=1 Tax=Fusobacterium necrophorum TaxID=859 RepID=UPI00254A04AD|nr:hypothetical protein [Fusobacterium necrophorum]MDK4473092.1 hypothetical protein [Fusobacterium necrophorum]MDK4478544.1 hypothetical protein [Fusobacterium necrophorum]MDK4519013.1 hypothetical protein [Fusobacterium necrophorum]
MSYYKENKVILGSSDVAVLTFVGCVEDYPFINADVLPFGEDGIYSGYVVYNNVEIPKHYKKEYSYKNWLKVYDDDGLQHVFEGKNIEVYRSGQRGIVIHIEK